MRVLCILVAVVASSGFSHADSLSSRAQTLGLSETWTYPMPSSPSNDTSYIKQSWNVSNGYIYGSNDISFVNDPYNDPYGGSGSVLKVLYPKGSYAIVGSRTDNGVTGGTNFFSQPFGNVSFDGALLQYDVAFDASFDWTLGGKLPGLFGGPPQDGCSGGKQSSGENCFSVRLMWRQAGAAEAYAYLPSSSSLCSKPLFQCDSDYGISIARGVFSFKTQQWSRIEMYIKINDPSQSNGVLQVWQDNNVVIYQNDMDFRTSNSVALSSLFFSTFFGGSTASYATTVDTYTYFRNIQLSVGNQSNLSSSASRHMSFAVTSGWCTIGALLFTLLLTL